MLPSWLEGLPNAMIEAMAAGLAVIVTPVGNIPNYVTHEKQALMIEPRKASDIANSIERLLCEDKTRVSIAKCGQRLAEERFAVEPGMECLIRVVKEAIGRP